MAAAVLQTQSPEMTFLLCCARVDIDSKTAEQMQGLLRSGLSWPLLLKQARTQKVMPLVYQSVQTVCLDALPQDIRQTLQRSFLANSFHNRFLTRELLKLLALFAAHNILALPYKGSALAVSIYGDLRLRMFGDLDIVVHPQDVMTAQNVLLSQGYRLLHSPQHTAAQRRFHFHLNFKRKDGKVPVELHWAFTPRHWFLPISFEQLWKKRTSVCLDGTTVPHFAPEDLLLILCVHGAKHCWDQLGWICDVAQLLRTYQTIDWARLMEQAADWRSVRILLVGLFLAHHLLHVELPEEIQREIQTDPIVAQLGEQVCQHLCSETEWSEMDRYHFYLRVREHWPDGARYLLHGLLPKAEDRALVALPEPLSFLYYLLRPIRLLKDHGVEEWKYVHKRLSGG